SSLIPVVILPPPMRNKHPFLRIAIFFILLFVVAFAVTSWQIQRQQSENTPKPIKSTFPADDVDREINLQEPAQRIAVIGPGATETIFQLGLGDRIVGRDQISDYPPAA